MVDDVLTQNGSREMPENLLHRSPLARKYAPALFFIGGFVWDAVTLGRTITPIDLFILAAYLIGAAVIVVLIGRGVTFRYSEYLNNVLQFFFGGIFSALFIFYFLSSGGLAGYLFVLGLAALLVGNEFLESRYSELTLSWTFFTLCALMFFNFALAHLFRSISTFWFYLGTLLAVLLVLVLRWLSYGGRRSDRGPSERGQVYSFQSAEGGADAAQSLAPTENSKPDPNTASVVPSLGVAGLLLVLHVFNVIPPVPLVKKEMLIAHEVHHEGRAYVARVESAGWRIWRTSSATYHRRDGEPVYCFTSVFVPNGIQTTIGHRWEHYDESAGAWRTMDRRSFAIEGGRHGGYRGYTYKQNVIPGLWRVTAESESGAAIGILDFTVTGGKPSRLKTLRR
jgi:hypothetical protein